MKILSARQLQDWDAYTIRETPIPSIDLMERAALACVNWLFDRLPVDSPVFIFCGKGNNGGDGLAIARLLIEKGSVPSVYVLEFGNKGTDDFQTNLRRLHELTKDIHFIQSPDSFPPVPKGAVVIDALYGIGLNRPLQDISAALVQYINKSGVHVISIDVPSGMFVDSSSKGHEMIKADHTLTFQSLKLCLLAAENAASFGKITVLDIGLHPAFLTNVNTGFEFVSKAQIVSYLKPRDRFSHKGKYGHALVVAGNTGMMGAAILCARACLRTGVGLLTVNVPAENTSVLHTAVPEAMVQMREVPGYSFNKFTAIGIGPGLGETESIQKMIFTILEQYQKPMVIDADALNGLSLNNDWLNKIPTGSVLTPHPKEFERLFGACENDFERWDKAVQLSKEYPFTILVKGHYTLIAAAGKGWFNTTGNAGLAKGGSGDVLTGMITSLLAQGYSSLEASLTGVYLHGLAADMALQVQSMESLLATDVIDTIGQAFEDLRQ